MPQIESHLLSVFRNCPVALSISRFDDRTFIDVNAAFSDLLGWSRDEAVGRTAADLQIVSPDTVTAIRARTDSDGAIQSHELAIKTRSGTARVVLLSTEVLSLAGERHIVSTFVDITDRKRLELSANRIAAIVESSDDAIIGKDLDGVVTSWNRGAESIFGYSAADILGRSIMLLIPDDRRAEEEQILDSIRSGRGVRHLETIRRTRDGRLIHVSITSSPIRDASGQIVGVSKVARDISDRKHSEEARQVLQARYHALFEHAPDGIIIADPDGRFIDVNASLCRMLGYLRPELVGRIGAEIVISEEANEVAAARARVQSGERIHREWRFRRKDLTVFTAEVLATVLPGGNLLAIVRDVTDRRTLEAQLRQSQKLQALGTLSAGIAHDFNNLLSIIVGNTALARQDLPADHAVQQSLSEIQTAGSRATDLVRRILMFGRQQETNRRVVTLQSVVEEGLKLLRATLPMRIEIRCTFDPATPDVSVDAAQVDQVILNLGANAAHAIGNMTGVLEFRVSGTSVGPDHAAVAPELLEGRYALLTVSDSGAGMDENTQLRAFEPFFTTKDTGQGTGLGLAMVHGIMKAHEGAINVYSEPGRGTTFRLYFPATTDARSAVAEPAAAKERGRGEHVLYIDDEEALIFLVTRHLERLGYRVTGMSNPLAALETFRSRPHDFDAVVSDLSMPGMSGIDLGASVRRIRPDVPIVFTSGYIRAEDTARAHEIGVSDLILKPNTIEELGQALHKVLRAPVAPEERGA